MQTDRIWHPYTKASAVADGPLPVIVRGEGIYLFDDAGNRYIDAISSWWACGLGHGHPRIVQAIQRQAETLQHSILGNLSHPNALELANQLSELAGGNRHVNFASDGASAVEAALKIAVQYWDNRGIPGRHSFLSLSDPYHGDTLGAVSVGYMENFHRPFKPLLFKSHTTPAPICSHCNHCPDANSCDAPCFASTLASLKEHREELAAVIVEPLCQGTAGIRMYGGAWLRRLAEACRELDILLIVDEIAMGFGRTGAMFAHHHAGIDPDIVCVGKSLTAGYVPLSAAIVKDEIYDTFSDEPEDHTLYHGHTFAGNPIGAAAALETLAVFREEDLISKVQTLAQRLAEAMAPIRDLRAVANVRTLGLIAAVELDSAESAKSVQLSLLNARILTRPLGPVIYLMPPLTIPEQSLLELVSALHQAIAQI